MNNLGLSLDSFVSKASEYEEVINRIDDGHYFVGLVEVVAVNIASVDVKPLSLLRTVDGEILKANTVYNVPFARFQSSSMGIILDPSIGDKGIIAVCDRDISKIKESKSYSVTPTRRRHSLSDSIYFGAVAGLNGAISHYIKIEKDLIEITSTQKVVINSDQVQINSDVEVSGDLRIKGNSITEGVATVGGLNFSTPGGEMPIIRGNWHIIGQWVVDGDITINGIKVSTHVHKYQNGSDESDTGKMKNA